MWILRFSYETNGNDQTWLAISILHLLQASQIQDLRESRHIRMLAPAELIERTVIDEVMKILKSPEVLMNLNRLAEEKQEISKSDLMADLKNLNEAWNYLYAAEQIKIVRMLVNSVEIQENGIKLNINLDGFDNLFVELAA